jgi:hypothetical protein
MSYCRRPMKVKIKDLKTFDLFLFHRQKAVCLGNNYFMYMKSHVPNKHWDYDLDKNVTVLGNMEAKFMNINLEDYSI